MSATKLSASTSSPLVLARQEATEQLTVSGSRQILQTREQIAEEVKEILADGNYIRARQLIAGAVEKFPADQSLQKLYLLLSPPKVKSRDDSIKNGIAKGSAEASNILGQQRNQQWLQQHGPAYQGQWVALGDGQLLGAAPSVRELRNVVGDLSIALVTKIF